MFELLMKNISTKKQFSRNVIKQNKYFVHFVSVLKVLSSIYNLELHYTKENLNSSVSRLGQIKHHISIPFYLNM